MPYAGACSTSFKQGQSDIQHLADLEIKFDRIRRATTRNGKTRLALMALLEEAFFGTKPPDQLRGGPADQAPHPRVYWLKMAASYGSDLNRLRSR